MLYHGLIHQKITPLMHFLCYEVSVEKATRVKAKLLEKVTLSSPSIREAETRQGLRLNDGICLWILRSVPHRRFTCPPKNWPVQKDQPLIFRGYVSFRGSIHWFYLRFPFEDLTFLLSATFRDPKTLQLERFKVIGSAWQRDAPSVGPGFFGFKSSNIGYFGIIKNKQRCFL